METYSKKSNQSKKKVLPPKLINNKITQLKALPAFHPVTSTPKWRCLIAANSTKSAGLRQSSCILSASWLVIIYTGSRLRAQLATSRMACRKTSYSCTDRKADGGTHMRRKGLQPRQTCLWLQKQSRPPAAAPQINGAPLFTIRKLLVPVAPVTPNLIYFYNYPSIQSLECVKPSWF